MNTKTIAVVVIFAALTITLNFSPAKIPAPYAPYLIYQIWEIPIVAAFLLYGTGAGVMIAVVNTLILLGVFPGELPTGPFYNLIAVLSMLVGLIAIRRFAGSGLKGRGEIVLIAGFTTLGIVFRSAVMALTNWALLRFPPPIGFSMPEDAIVLAIPLVVFFNATLALYTIPIGYYLAKTAKAGMK